VFRNLGKALALLRDLRGKNQAQIARAAGMGKSQLSKYESGKELPRLDSLERLLDALGVSAQDFFHTMALVNDFVSSLDAPAGLGARLALPLPGNSLLSAEAEKSFSKIFAVILDLHRLFYEEPLLTRMPEPRAGDLGGPEALDPNRHAG
jgi:transcriptional regulator with XRE-family HTH domain